MERQWLTMGNDTRANMTESKLPRNYVWYALRWHTTVLPRVWLRRLCGTTNAPQCTHTTPRHAPVCSLVQAFIDLNFWSEV